jgi:small-conductance mechanosensitive channel
MPLNPIPLSVQFQEYFVDTINFLPTLIVVLLVMLVAFLLATWLRGNTRRGLEKRKVAAEVVLLLEQVVYWSVLSLGAVFALQRIGVNLTALIAGMGAVGFTIGFALQDVGKNLIAGVLLLLQRPFQIGDVIEVVGFTGAIKTITLRATEMTALDGRQVWIPNGDIYINPITNFSQPTRRRVEISLGVTKNSNLEAVRQAALAIVPSLPGLLPDPAPAVFFQLLGSNTVDLVLYFWIDTAKTDPATAKDAGLVALKTAFDNAGIEIPYPTQMQIAP